MTETLDKSKSATLLISCPDSQGIVAAVTKFIADYSGNVIHLDQHVDFQQDVFFMRVEWEIEGFGLPPDQIAKGFQPIADAFVMDWDLRISGRKPRMAIFVSKLSHCLYDILARQQSGEWDVDIPIIISNHSDLEPLAKQFNIEFHCLPITPETKDEQERRQVELLKQHHIDFIVLARYMQIISTELLSHFPHRIINIHHSFLPAFPGAKPYHSAYARGVKIIGATSHYVTEELDAGPIIEQDIIRVSHKDSVEDLVRRGRDLEKMVLARAIWHHLRNKILVYNNKTVIFE